MTFDPSAADPRRKNRTFSAKAAKAYLLEYVESLACALEAIPADSLDAAVDLLESAMREGRRIYVCGNGGSAAIADHLCCDWTKGSKVAGIDALRTHSLASNAALFTAVANDFGYERSFSAQVEFFGQSGDVLAAISSSGNSPNVIGAVEAAKAKGMRVLGFSGFEGGALARLSDISLHVPFANYGLVEDGHQIMMHVLSQFLTLRLESGPLRA